MAKRGRDLDQVLQNWAAQCSEVGRKLGYSKESTVARLMHGQMSGGFSNPTERAALRVRFYAHIHSLVMQLQVPWRKVVIMRFVARMTYRQIADEIGIPESKVYSRMSDIKEWMTDEIRARYNERGENEAVSAMPRVIEAMAIEAAREPDMEEQRA